MSPMSQCRACYPRCRLPQPTTSAEIHVMLGPRALPIALGLLCLASTAASASVQLRVGTRSDTLQHCESGQLAFALWNDDAEPLRVRVFGQLGPGGVAQLGPRHRIGGMR